MFDGGKLHISPLLGWCTNGELNMFIVTPSPIISSFTVFVLFNISSDGLYTGESISREYGHGIV